MNDIGLFLKDNCFDIDTENGDIKNDGGLETAVAISLFTDRRVEEDELPDLETGRRGWWADPLLEVDQDKIGSRLWTMDRSKVLTETLRRSEELCKESLNWMKEDGISGEITAQSEYNESKELIINLAIERPDDETARFIVYWDRQEVRRL